MLVGHVRGVDDGTTGSPLRVSIDRKSTVASPASNIPSTRIATFQFEAPRAHAASLGAMGASTGDTGAHGESIGCRCRHSRCSKMYCECFAAGRYCTSLCECIECENCSENEPGLARIRSGIRRRNPDAFLAKIDNRFGIRKHTRGCRCTRSKCLKRYCECFREGMSCTADCECRDCHNGRYSSSVLPPIGAPTLDMEGCFLNALDDFLEHS